MNPSKCHLLLKSCKTLNQLKQIHAQSITQSLHPHHQPLSCKILNLYSNLNRPIDALNVFTQIPDPDLITLTSLINLHLHSNQPRKAIWVFAEILKSGKKPDGFAAVGALSASGLICDLKLGKSLHGFVLRHGLGFETVVNNALVDTYCRNGRLELAKIVFDEMGERDPVSWSSLLHGYVIYGSLEHACELFDEMTKRDVVCWTVMITGHVQRKCPVRALELFSEMKLEGHRPTLITIVGVLSACADIGALDLGRAIHGCIAKINLGLDVTIVYNALIDMYSKSGDLKMAVEIFKGTMKKDVYTWTTMISGFAVHGQGLRAIKVFNDMLDSGIRPNEVTFLSVLLACSHSGLVNEGRVWFKKMSEIHKLKPKVEHYGCMVDLFGRAGQLKEAKKLVKEMSRNPDCVIWRSLLSASLVHGDIKLAETAGREIIKQDPNDDGVYVLLWNMYASSNRWEEAREMRKEMTERKLVKMPGCSWIELDGIVHEFLVEDRIHLLCEDICLILEGISKHLKMDTVPFFEDDCVWL
ncbi:uncharacterized protein A4U43_C07F22790 [Asparagus officinalis]|uniref:Uncharacterized protein n=1 Tax=Asparagus officinalis TaxID=4686 RepID=A0A5P1EG31_ASPOF|nr:pentatricopeptide repeat-containing protein ELI1, chloroplastic-like [Asparagus officinalis]ONK64167.1 uncharacterized protein A4U43_C07F22790 [Asparagus officinalis]